MIIYGEINSQAKMGPLGRMQPEVGERHLGARNDDGAGRQDVSRTI